MREYERWEIAGGTLEYYNDTHTYLYEGILLPSITQMLSKEFGNKYKHVPKDTLKRASDLGTAVHEAIEDYEKTGHEAPYKEVRNWKFLKKAYNFECIGNEIPVVLFHEGEPIACGRLDLVLREGDEVGLGDIKRTSQLDKEYVAYQLNLYRIAYEHNYGERITFLRAVHLRDDTRKYINIPITEDFIKQKINEWR